MSRRSLLQFAVDTANQDLLAFPPPPRAELCAAVGEVNVVSILCVSVYVCIYIHHHTSPPFSKLGRPIYS